MIFSAWRMNNQGKTENNQFLWRNKFDLFQIKNHCKNDLNLKFVRTSRCFQKSVLLQVSSKERMKFVSAVFQMKTVAYLQLSYQLLKRSLHWRLGIYHLQKKLILFNLHIQNSHRRDHHNALRPRGLTVYSRNQFLNLPPESH